MIGNVLGELPLTADLHYFTNRARFDVIDIPADDLLPVIAKNNLPEISARLHAVHESQKPCRQMEVLFRPKRIARAVTALTFLTTSGDNVSYGPLPAPRPSLQAESVDVAVVRANINQPIRH